MLEVDWFPLEFGLGSVYLEYESAGSAPDVWLQLLERCAAEPDCQPTALCSLAQQLPEQRARQEQQVAGLRELMSAQQHAATERLAGLQDRLSAQQHQASAQDRLIAAQQRQIAGLQEQLSAQQRTTAEHMAGLQAQLQELHAAVQQVLPPHR